MNRNGDTLLREIVSDLRMGPLKVRDDMVTQVTKPVIPFRCARGCVKRGVFCDFL